MKFDVVIGNPPYQDKKGNGSHPIYRKFVQKSFEWVDENGYVSFICPPGIFNTSNLFEEGVLFSKFKNVHLMDIDMNVQEKYFPKIGSPICRYIMKNNKIEEYKTKINGIEQDIRNLKFIPRIFSPLIYSIFKKITNTSNNINFEYRKQIKSKKYVVVFKELNHISNKKGNLKSIVLDSNNPNIDNYSFKRFFDNLDEANNLKTYLDSKVVSFFNYIIRYNSVIHNGIISKIKEVDLTRSWTDEELYKHFNLTEDEIKFIEEQVK